MPTTTTHAIYYPAGTAVPNIPVQEQTQAESVEAAINKVTKAPFVICNKTDSPQQGAPGTTNTFTDITWHTELVKQGITHAAGSASFVVGEAGIYTANVRVASDAGPPVLTIILNINGVDISTTRTDQVGSSSAYAKPAFTTNHKLLAGDVVKVRAKSSVAGSLFLGSESQFTLYKVAIV